MTYPPRARVIVAPLTDGWPRAALVVDSVSDAGAYRVRFGDGTRAVVAAGRLSPNVKDKSPADTR